MLAFIVQRFWCLQQGLVYFILQSFGWLSRIVSHSIENPPFGRNRPNDVEPSLPCEIPEGSSTCETYTVQLQPQHDLKVVGVGASGQLYDVGDQVVLKSCQIYAPPSSDASRSDLWHYASDTLFNYSLLKDERTVLQLLQNRPHPHIIEAIDTHQPEGLYLRRYQPVSSDVVSTQARRIRLYCEIAEALRHLHSLGIVHADVRVDNILLDDRLSAVLCDFSAASPCGEPNLVFPDLPLPVNGPSPILSEKSDMFALASLMFDMEHGCTPELSLENGRLTLPGLKSGNDGVDGVIQNAWLGNYTRTSQMVHRLAALDVQTNRGTERLPVLPDFEPLRDQVEAWRHDRKQKFGCVLEGILSDHQLKVLAEQYNMDPNANRRFDHYRLPS